MKNNKTKSNKKFVSKSKTFASKNAQSNYNTNDSNFFSKKENSNSNTYSKGFSKKINTDKPYKSNKYNNDNPKKKFVSKSKTFASKNAQSNYNTNDSNFFSKKENSNSNTYSKGFSKKINTDKPYKSNKYNNDNPKKKFVSKSKTFASKNAQSNYNTNDSNFFSKKENLDDKNIDLFSDSQIKIEDIIYELEINPLSLEQICKNFNIPFNKKENLLEILNKLVQYRLLKMFGNNKYKIRLEYIKNTTIPKISLLKVIGNNVLGEKIATFSTFLYNKLNLKDFQIFIEHNLSAKNININDHFIANIKKINKNTLVAKILKRIPFKNNALSNIIVGLTTYYNNQCFLIPLGRKYKNNFLLDLNNQQVKEKSLIKAQINLDEDYSTPKATLLEIISEKDISEELSLLTANEYFIPIEFSNEALEEAKQKETPTLGNRIDLRNIPLVTIDGDDAKDFDDAVFVTKLENNNYRVIVAIADVSYYVEENSTLDIEAMKRGNSVYLPGLVIPMLPEALSNGLCSLMPNEDRACFVADMTINENAILKNFKFYKGLMKSHARLTYREVENALNGELSEKTSSLMDKVIKPLYECWKILDKASTKRSALNIETNEYKVNFNQDNTIQSISLREKLNSNKIIEELMILANVSAAKFLYANKNNNNIIPYRVHDKPSFKKLETLKSMLKSINVKTEIPKIITTKFFNDLLNQYKDSDLFETINEIVLRSQAQAKYSIQNIGHFGLALKEYCHFTSPIRRYADLMVHRLINKVLLGETSYMKTQEAYSIVENLSTIERTASSAEFSAIEKITAKFLEGKINTEFRSTISSITNSGIFIKTDDIGANGLIPMRTLGNERFNLINGAQKIVGMKSKKSYKVGQKLNVILQEVNIIKGLLTFIIK